MGMDMKISDQGIFFYQITYLQILDMEQIALMDIIWTGLKAEQILIIDKYQDNHLNLVYKQAPIIIILLRFSLRQVISLITLELAMKNSPTSDLSASSELPEDPKKEIQELYSQTPHNPYISFATKLQMRAKSPYISLYFRNLFKKRPPPSLQSVKHKLDQSKSMFMNEFKKIQPFSIQKIRETRNKKIMEFQVSFYYFVTHVRVLNLEYKDNLHLNLKKCINQGGFGTIYQVHVDSVQYAVKKLNISNYDLGNSLNNAIKEYSFIKCCGILQIGPAYRPLFGFDMITTQTQIYFSCQLGVPIYEYVKSKINCLQDLERDFQSLQESLILLHTFKINHNDIKTSNIVYSETFRKLVLLDFGLSDVNKVDFGYMKAETVKGSIDYVCDDMKKLFFDNLCQGLVDLFYNDMIALEKSKQNIKSIFKVNNSCTDSANNHHLKHSSHAQYKFLSDDNDFYLIHEKQEEHSYFSYLKGPDSQIQQIIILKIISLIDIKDVIQFQTIVNTNPLYLKVLNKHLRTISFVFFEAGKDTALELMYRTVKKSVQSSPQILPETLDFINFELQPYFNIPISSIFRAHNSYLNLCVQQKASNSSIASRYGQNSSAVKVHNKNNQYHIQYTQITVRSKKDTKQAVEYLIDNLQRFGYEQISEIINLQIARVYSLYYWYEITEIQINFLEQFLLKLNLKVKFEFLNELGQQISVKLNEKLVFYISIFINFYLRIGKNFQFCPIICNLIQQYTPSNVANYNQICISLMQLSRKSPFIKEKDPLKTEQSNFQSSGRLANMQQCLNIIQKFLKILQPYFGYEQNLELNMRFCEVIDEKIREIIYIYCEIHQLQTKRGYPSSIFKSAYLCLEIILTKFRDHKRRNLSGVFASARAVNDFVTSIDIYKKLFYELQSLRIYECYTEQQIKETKLRELFDKCKQEKNPINQWYMMDKEVFEAVIFTSVVPYSQYQKFCLLRPYFSLAQKNKSLDFRKVSSYMMFFLISSSYNLALEIDDYTALKNIFKIVKQTEGFITNINFCSIVYQCVRKYNNSKRIKDCERNFKFFKKITPKIQSHQYYQIYSQVQSFKKFTQLQIQTRKAPQKPISPQNVGFCKTNQKKKVDLALWQKMVEKQWQKIVSSDHKNIYFPNVMMKLNQIMKRIFYSRDQDQEQIKSIYFKYSNQYEQQMKLYQRWMEQRIDAVRSIQNINQKILNYFHVSQQREQYFWSRVKAVNFILQRQRILRIITRQFYLISQSKSDILDKEWQNFQLKYHQLQPKIADKKFAAKCSLHERCQQIYLELKYRLQINKLINQRLLNGKQQDLSQSYHIINEQTQCIQSFTCYVNAHLLINERLKQNKANSQIQQIMMNQIFFTGFSKQDCLMHQQSFIIFVLACQEKIIDKNFVEKVLEQENRVSRFFKGKFNAEQLLKHIFQSMVDQNRIHKFFNLEETYMRFLYHLIKIGLNSIVLQQKQKGLNCYFLTYLFYYLFKFAEAQSCSSYSYLILGLINYFNQHLLNRLLQSKVANRWVRSQQSNQFNRGVQEKNKQKQKQMSQNKVYKAFEFINDFEKDLIKLLVEDEQKSKIQTTSVILLSCQKIKLQILIDFLRNKQTHKIYQQSIRINHPQIPLKLQTSLMEKVQYFICFKINGLQFLSKSYMKQYLFCYLVMLNLGNRKYDLFMCSYTQNLAFGRSQIYLTKSRQKYQPSRIQSSSQTQTTLSKKIQQFLSRTKKPQLMLKFPYNKLIQQRERYFEVKHFRNTRKIIEKQKFILSGILISFQLNQRCYYSIFEPIDSKILSRIALKKLAFRSRQNDTFCSKKYGKVYKLHQTKVQKFIQIACANIN